MLKLKLQRMRFQLIRGGVAPKFVKRTLTELDAHYHDLKNHAIADGLPEREASAKANSAIGDEKTLVAEFLNKPELKSWLWRYPKSIFLLLPLLTLLVCTVAMGALLLFVYARTPAIEEMFSGVDISLWVKILLECLLFFIFYLLTPLLAAGTILIAKQRMIKLHWPIIGMALLMIVGCGSKYTLNWPAEATIGNLNMNWGYSFLPQPVRGFHDLQNLMNMLISISFAAIAWRLYRPYESTAENP